MLFIDEKLILNITLKFRFDFDFLGSMSSGLHPHWVNQHPTNPMMMGHPQPLVDTSVLPPPPRVPWTNLDGPVRYDSTESVPSNDGHAKLERQLTLNPVSDPRILMPRLILDSNDKYPYPPPMISNFHQLHYPVKRNSSAPEQPSLRMTR